MWIRASQENIEQAANDNGITLQELRPNPRGRGFLLRLKLGPTKKYQRLNHKLTRKVAAVCWHGHRDFMRSLFELEPTAKIDSSFAKYHGVEDFESRFEATYKHKIGSIMEPRYYGDACQCDDTSCTFGTLQPNGQIVNVREIRHSDLARCPHTILMPEHYRNDGTCKCGDKSHSIMAEWGYEWDGKRWS